MQTGKAPHIRRWAMLAFLWLIFLGHGQEVVAGPVDATASIILQIDPEIDCPACEDGIRFLLLRRRGVRKVKVDVMTSRVKIEYLPAQVTPAALIATIGIMEYHARIVK